MKGGDVIVQSFDCRRWARHYASTTSFMTAHTTENGEPPGSLVLKQVFGEFYATRIDQIELLNPEAFTDVEAREVAVFIELDWLAISGSRITDKGLEDIARLKHLGRLDIEGCKVSKEAVKQLRRALPDTNIFSDDDRNLAPNL